jgi:hypothetical protein
MQRAQALTLLLRQQLLQCGVKKALPFVFPPIGGLIETDTTQGLWLKKGFLGEFHIVTEPLLIAERL